MHSPLQGLDAPNQHLLGIAGQLLGIAGQIIYLTATSHERPHISYVLL
jgi:hypothetical protein